MRFVFPTILLLCLLAGCKGKDGIPSNVLPQPKMKAVLWDMVRADVFLNDYWLRRPDSSFNRKLEFSKVYQQVFKANEVSKEEFQRSFDFYQNHPALLKPMLDSITKHSNDPASRRLQESAIDTSHKIVKPLPFFDTARTRLKRKAIVAPKKTS